MVRIITLISFLTLNILYAQVGINTENPDPSAALDVSSSQGGLLIPRMTKAQKDAISSPATGLMIYQMDTLEGFYYYRNGWIAISEQITLDDMKQELFSLVVQNQYMLDSLQGLILDQKNQLDFVNENLRDKIDSLIIDIDSLENNFDSLAIDLDSLESNLVKIDTLVNDIVDTENVGDCTPFICLMENGITLKALDSAIVGNQYVYNGIIYFVAGSVVEAKNYGDLSRVITTRITDMSGMFQNSNVTDDITSWDVSNVINMRAMFFNSPNFNQDISKWDVRNVRDMSYMFHRATSFNQDIGNWDVSTVRNDPSDPNDPFFDPYNGFVGMFFEASNFNQDIGSWDVRGATSLAEMFRGASSFNQDIGNWVVSNVVSLTGIFREATSFNGNISTWDVSNVTGMVDVFREASNFNQDLSNWDVSNVVSMNSMFYKASVFNRNISSWNVVNVIDMTVMFREAYSFNQNLTSWAVGNVTSCTNFSSPTFTLEGPLFSLCNP